jgi:ubiquinone/menaquinone biosynthesis C-methylase UbiE
MAERDIFSIRRPLDPPIGIPRDFIGSTIEDPELAKLVEFPAIEARLNRDTMPIPSTRDREGYYGDRHFEYWLSGLSDYLKIKEVCGMVNWAGASLLDFGGATGRVARHFYAQDDLAEVMICDVNINNVEWIIEYLPPGFAAFKNSATPSLPIPDDYFDVVTAFSVFTHMNEYELGWLYELRRILKPNGILYATVHNDDTWRILPSTWVFNVLMQSEAFRAFYQPEREISERLIFEYSSASTYNCNAFHPNAYLHRVWGRVFTIRDIRPICHSYQSAVVLQKEPRRIIASQTHKPQLEDGIARLSAADRRIALQERTAGLSELSEADLLALIPDLAELLRRTGTEHWWMKKRVFEAFEAQGFHVTQDHYYSPQPTVTKLAPDLWDGPRYLNPAFAFDLERMQTLFDELSPFAAELADIPRTGTSSFYWDNNFFPNFDAIIYYGLCRRFCPAIVLEVGSGFSTHIALRAAQQNGVTQVRCIEPYPTPTLQAIGDRLSQLLVQPVQDVPLDLYHDLRAGDILFVDTSHVSKLGNDLHHILFHVLPALPAGVLVHFHDIFLPYEYPREWVVERNWFWNEQYLLLAFLMYNTTFRVVFMNNHFLYMCPQVAKRALEALNVGPLQGASMWLRKEHP